MKRNYMTVGLLVLGIMAASCSSKEAPSNEEKTEIVNEIGDVKVDRFADIQVLRYEINDFDKLSLDQKKLVYYLSQAGLAGRDINWDQNNPYNLKIRKAIEHIFESYEGERSGDEWNKFETYAKQVWFANGIHHHYGMEKFNPKFSKEYFHSLLKAVDHKLDDDTIDLIFNSERAKLRKIKDPKLDIISASANGFYGPGVTQKMVEEFYASKTNIDPKRPVEHGLNSTLVLKDGKLYEDVWKSGGKYGKAIDQII